MKALYLTKITILMGLVLVALSSCKKWLDVQPETRLVQSELFKTEGGYRDAMAGVYGGLSSTSLYGRELTFATMDVLAGYYTPINSGNTAYYEFFNSYPYKRDNASKSDKCVTIVDGFWTGLYGQVAQLNGIIQTIDGNKKVFSGDNYSTLKGEAIGLRAFLHLDLLRMYGSSYVTDPMQKAIPFVDTLSSQVTKLMTVDEACNKIIQELQRSLALMVNDPIKQGRAPSDILASAVATTTLAAYHNRRYHFNYYAVKAALARAYLWKGDKANALRYAKEIIAEQPTRFPWVLDANLTSIGNALSYNKDRTFTTEHIFALNIRNLELDVPNYFSSAGSSAQNQNLLPTTATVKNRIYENNTIDPRNQYLFTSYGSSFFSTKLYQDQEALAQIWFKNQMPIIRISEMYYIAAECEPDMATGRNWLNVIRQVRKLSALTSVEVNTTTQLMNQIQKEYEKEFIGEGQLWYFYKRRDLATLPNSRLFTNKAWYTFDMPDEEYTNGGR